MVRIAGIMCNNCHNLFPVRNLIFTNMEYVMCPNCMVEKLAYLEHEQWI